MEILAALGGMVLCGGIFFAGMCVPYILIARGGQRLTRRNKRYVLEPRPPSPRQDGPKCARRPFSVN